MFFGGFISRQGMAEESISKFKNYNTMNLKTEKTITKKRLKKINQTEYAKTVGHLKKM